MKRTTVFVVAVLILVVFTVPAFAQEPVETAATTEDLEKLALRSQLAQSEVRRLLAQLDRDYLQRSIMESRLAVLEVQIPALEAQLEQARENFKIAVDALNAAQAGSLESQEAIEEAGPPPDAGPTEPAPEQEVPEDEK